MPEIGLAGTNLRVLPELETWGWEIATALFLCGAAAGLGIVGSAFRLRDSRPSRIVRVADLLGLPVLASGAFFLWVDLGNRMNIWRVYLAFEPTSVMWWGSWIVLLSLGLLALRFLAELLSLRVPAGRPLAVAGVVLGTGLGAYTGLLLATIAARPLWSSALLPLVFLASAIGTGTTLLWLGGGGERPRLRRVEVALWTTELLLLLAYAASLRLGAEPAQRAFGLLSGGLYGLTFWGVAVTLGVALPLVATMVAEARRVHLSGVPLAVANLIGSLSLRLVVVYAGVLTTL